MSLQTYAARLWRCFPEMCLSWVLLFAPLKGHAQTSGRFPEQGQSIIRNYSSREYGASAQNWAVLQDERGFLYVGNNECLLEYDGHRWQRIPGTDGGVFALAQSDSGVIYAGGAGDFGYLKPDAKGQRHFFSLSEQLPPEARNFGVIRSIHILGDTVFFQSRQTLFLYHHHKLHTLTLPDSYLRAYVANGAYYLRFSDTGLCRWQNHQFQPLPGGSAFADETIVCLLPYQNNHLLIGTQKNGIWAYSPSSGKRWRPEGFTTLQDQFQKEELYHGVPLPGGGYAFGTLSTGIYLTEAGGTLKRRINRTLGLNDNTVHHLFVDRQQGLWAAMNHGLDRVSLQAPFQYWDAGLGLDAAVLCLKRHRNTLYAGTNLGLYVLTPSPVPASPSRFRRVDDQWRDQVFALEELQLPGESAPQLFLATGTGLYGLNDKGAVVRLHTEEIGPVYAVAPSRANPGTLYAGGNQGLFRLRYRNGRWSPPEPLGAGDLLIRSVAEDRNGHLWIGTRNRGFARLEAEPDGGFRTTFFERLQDRQAIGDHRIFSWGETLLFRSSQFGAFLFDEKKQQFEPFYLPDPPAPDHQRVWIAATGPGRDLWLWAPATDGTQLVWRRETAPGVWERIAAPFGVLPDVRDLFQGGFYPESDQIAWMGGAAGLYRFAAHAMPDSIYYQQPFDIVLRSVRIGTDSLWTSNWPNAVAGTRTLTHLQNAIQFQFAALAFERPENIRYRYFLEGHDRQWSAWTAKTEKEYTNLAPGSYVFRVRARNAFSREAICQDFTFEVLPPWYQTWWAYFLYLALTGSVIFGLVRLLTLRQARILQREQQINEQLRNADKLKDQFLANTSHELRTPLNGIIGLSESLLDGLGKFSEEKQREELSLIISSGRRLAGLVNDLLDFSRLKEKDLQLRPTAVDLHALTDVVLQICQPLTTDKDLALVNRVPEETTVLADEDRLQQILLNLVGNAIKFTDHGSVTLSAQTAAGAGGDPEIEIAVRDTGIGIPKEKQNQIFQAFQQADGSVERQFGGTGLGLAISKSLIELQGGRIWVESEAGQGATFFFTLPASDSPAAGRPAPTAQTLPHAPAIQKQVAQTQTASDGVVRILIVDDEPINHHVLRNHLQNEPVHLTSAWNGEEALAFLESGHTYDLVLLDVMMPRMSGYEVCRRIREKYLPSELPIIMITAKNQVQDLVQGLSMGANDYLAKPFSKEEFLARLHTQLDLHRIFDVTARFVPNEFIQALGYERLTEVSLGDHAQREVTVLFSDIRNYTSLAENMTPEENFRFINSYNRRMGPVIRKHRGFINQYLGDGIMAIFPHEAEQALTAAIDMQRELQAYNRSRVADRHDPIRVGMGLHSGSLIMGITGDDARLDAATVSDTVNTSSRIENLTIYYNVNILLSEDTLREIPHPERYHLRHLGRVQVKGKQQPIAIYECFDGDEPEDVALKQATRDQFNLGVEYFFQRNFEASVLAFKAVLQQHPADGAAKLFLQKSSHYLRHGVPADWTGVEKMDRK